MNKYFPKEERNTSMNKMSKKMISLQKRICLFFLVVCFVTLSFSSALEKTLWSFSYFGEDDFFYQPSDIEVDFKRSLIYVADSGNKRVVVFDFNGKYLKTVGNPGQGPGEFSKPTGICVLEDSSLAVVDFGNRRIHIFNESGDFIRAIDCKSVPVADLIFYEDRIYTVSSHGTSGYNLNMRSKAGTQPLVSILSEEGDLLKSITIKEFPDSHPFIRALNHRVALTLSKDNKLFLPFFAMNVIQFFDLNGEKLGEFDRPMKFKPGPPELQSQRSGKSSDGGTYISMSATLDMVTKDAKIGPDGNLYLLTYTESLKKQMKRIKSRKDRPPLPMQFDVIDPKAKKLLKNIECDAGAVAFALIDKNRLVYIYEDSEGEVVFKCIEN